MTNAAELSKQVDNYLGISTQIANIGKKALAVVNPAKYLENYRRELEEIKKRVNEHIIQRWKEADAWQMSDEQKSALIGSDAVAAFQQEIRILNANFPDIDSALRQSKANSVESLVGVSAPHLIKSRPITQRKRRAAPRATPRAAPRAAPKRKAPAKRKTTTKRR